MVPLPTESAPLPTPETALLPTFAHPNSGTSIKMTVTLFYITNVAVLIGYLLIGWGG